MTFGQRWRRIGTRCSRGDTAIIDRSLTNLEEILTGSAGCRAPQSNRVTKGDRNERYGGSPWAGETM